MTITGQRKLVFYSSLLIERSRLSSSLVQNTHILLSFLASSPQRRALIDALQA